MRCNHNDIILLNLKNVNIWGGDYILEISDGTFQNIFPAKKLSAERLETEHSEISLDLE